MADTPLPFTGRPAVPLVGQPYSVTSGFITAVLLCHCGGHKTPVLLVADKLGQCALCSTRYALHSGECDHTTGHAAVRVVTVANETPGLIQ